MRWVKLLAKIPLIGTEFCWAGEWSEFACVQGVVSRTGLRLNVIPMGKPVAGQNGQLSIVFFTKWTEPSTMAKLRPPRCMVDAA